MKTRSFFPIVGNTIYHFRTDHKLQSGEMKRRDRAICAIGHGILDTIGDVIKLGSAVKKLPAHLRSKVTNLSQRLRSGIANLPQYLTPVDTSYFFGSVETAQLYNP